MTALFDISTNIIHKSLVQKAGLPDNSRLFNRLTGFFLTNSDASVSFSVNSGNAGVDVDRASMVDILLFV